MRERTRLGHDYLIKWCDGSTSEQKEEHLFVAFSHRSPLRPDVYLLALDDAEEIYRPARIRKVSDDEKTLCIEYRQRNSWSK